jgi:hypothetical protein
MGRYSEEEDKTGEERRGGKARESQYRSREHGRFVL